MTFVIATALGAVVPAATGDYQVKTFPPRSCAVGGTLAYTIAIFILGMIQLCVVTILTLVLSFEVYNVSLYDGNVA